MKAYNEGRCEARKAYMKVYNRQLKMAALLHYGECCQCCGESWPVFLTIDHVAGDGAAHRLSIGSKDRSAGSKFYLWLRNNNYPPGFQVLCFNCNFAKHVKKVCPHQSTTGRKP